MTKLDPLLTKPRAVDESFHLGEAARGLPERRFERIDYPAGQSGLMPANMITSSKSIATIVTIGIDIGKKFVPGVRLDHAGAIVLRQN